MPSTAVLRVTPTKVGGYRVVEAAHPLTSLNRRVCSSMRHCGDRSEAQCLAISGEAVAVGPGMPLTSTSLQIDLFLAEFLATQAVEHAA